MLEGRGDVDLEGCSHKIERRNNLNIISEMKRRRR
tara:strand:- start:44 stop:148 length:105 start_codon:yes stop_codon:yes gene_type:complete